ncbi:MAG: suppressor of fused domain protein, partial [Gemmataceae bacterium]
PDGPIHNAVSWARCMDRQDIYDYLIANGGVEPNVVYRPRSPSPLDEEIITHFQSTRGPSYLLEWMDCIPLTPRISVHVIPPTPGRPHQTLFTTGISSEETFPSDTTSTAAANACRYAELFIDVSANWDVSEAGLKQPQFGWLIQAIQQIGQTPYQMQDWFGDDYSIFANDEPPQPFAEGVPFTALLCRPEGHLLSVTGRRIQLYRVTPVTTAQRDLAARHGLAALLDHFGGEPPRVLEL